jgi:hypothetical protein
MKRRNEKGIVRSLGDAELATIAGGADCETLIKLRIAAEDRGDDAWAGFFQGAINGSGCSGPNCHGARNSGGQHA